MAVSAGEVIEVYAMAASNWPSLIGDDARRHHRRNGGIIPTEIFRWIRTLPRRTWMRLSLRNRPVPPRSSPRKPRCRKTLNAEAPLCVAVRSARRIAGRISKQYLVGIIFFRSAHSNDISFRSLRRPSSSWHGACAAASSFTVRNYARSGASAGVSISSSSTRARREFVLTARSVSGRAPIRRIRHQRAIAGTGHARSHLLDEVSPVPGAGALLISTCRWIGSLVASRFASWSGGVFSNPRPTFPSRYAMECFRLL